MCHPFECVFFVLSFFDGFLLRLAKYQLLLTEKQEQTEPFLKQEKLESIINLPIE